jgi:glutathione S-transferase
MAKIDIVSAGTCPFAQRTRMVLLEKRVDFSLTEIDLDAKPAWFLEISPYAKVPVIRHGDAVVWESAVINEYLEEVFPEPALLPRDALQRAQARVWIDFANTRMVPHVYKMMLRQDSEGQELHRRRLTEAVLAMEQGLRELSNGPFWFGAEPGLVDFTFFPHVQRFVALEHYRGFKIPAHCERLVTWRAAMLDRPSVEATRPSDALLIKNWAKYAHDTSTGVTAQEMRES